MAILGGMGTASGPLIGALLLSGLNEILEQHFLSIHALFFGIVIVLMILFLPRGLMYLVGLRGGVRRWLGDLQAYRA